MGKRVTRYRNTTSGFGENGAYATLTLAYKGRENVLDRSFAQITQIHNDYYIIKENNIIYVNSPRFSGNMWCHNALTIHDLMN